MITSRFLFSVMAGLFGLFLGSFALVRNPYKRLNQFFGLYAISTAFWWTPLVGWIEPIFGYQTALLSYRTSQYCLMVSSFFFLSFIQELTGIFDASWSRAIRRTFVVILLLSFPFLFTPFVVKSYSTTILHTDMVFEKEFGPVFYFWVLFHFLNYLMVMGIAYAGYKGASGFKRNQLKFILLGLSSGLVALFVYYLSSMAVDLPWIYFPLTAGMMLCFAYAIFKYRLFEFNIWMSRFSIYLGVYLPITILPFLLYLPLRPVVLPPGEPRWLWLAAGTLLYGILFSIAPFLTTYLRTLSEKKRWVHFNQQLEFVKNAAESLADESGLSVPDVSSRVMDVLQEFYWRRIKTPLRFVVSAFINDEGRVTIATFPSHEVDKTILNSFLINLKNLPLEILSHPFGWMEIDHKFAANPDSIYFDYLESIKKYLKKNDIEVCCPCLHDKKFYGVILLGPKEKGVFWPEEFTTLHLTASHAATAVRKSELLASNRELKALDQLKSDLIANITHEFKNPTQIIENAVQILMDEMKKDRMDREKLGKYLLMIRNNNGKLNIFIRDLLDVAKIEESKIDLKKIQIDLGKVLKKSVDVLHPLAAKKGLDLRLSTLEPVPLNIDLGKMDQVFCNLISNSIKFTEKGFIDIQLSRDNGVARVTVRDTGQGIDPQYLPSVFDKFFLGPQRPLTQAMGSGLGLTIAKGWVLAHDGKIWAESDGEGKGATFIVELPVPN